MVWDPSTKIYNDVPLVPLRPGGKVVPVNLAPNTHFERGRVIGQINNAANDVQTATSSGGATGGKVVIEIAHPMNGMKGYFELNWNSSAAAAATAIRSVVGTQNYNTGGGPLNTTPITFTAAGDFVEMPVLLMRVVQNLLTGGSSPNVTFAKTTHGRSAGTFGHYATANVDGTGTARGLIERACTTDSAGNVHFGTVATEGWSSQAMPHANMFVEGVFDIQELVGFDADAAADLGRVVRGPNGTGEVYLIGG